MKVAIILFDVDLNYFNFDNYYTIGVDRGALNAVSNNIKLDLAVGDFDSVNIDEFEAISKNSKSVIKLNPIKDDTDTLFAINKAYQLSNDVTIFGGIKGNRIEHFLSILGLLLKYKDLKIIDNSSLIFRRDESFTLTKEDIKDYKFFSVFSLSNDLRISLKGFKYNLDNFNLKIDNTAYTISNQLIEDEGKVSINNKALFILSKADNKNNVD